MKQKILMAAVAIGLGAPAILSAPAEAAGAGQGEAGTRLSRHIQQGLREGGPFFTPEERAVIERACGYAPGSWDGFEANMSDGVFRCSNGRRVDSPEVRAVMAAAGPRIGARVRRVMESAEVRGAIAEISQRARAQALRAVDSERIAEQASARARAAVRRAFERMEEAEERGRRR